MLAGRLALAVACSAAITGAHAEKWHLGASAGLTGTYTNNVFYEAQGQAVGDFVTSLTGGFTVTGEGARVKLNGSAAITLNFYAKESEQNSIAPNVALAGSVEAIEKFFFVDAAASINTQFLSPFGPQPASVVTATDNRYVSQTYTVSPYIKGVLGPSNISYLVRNDNIWTLSSPFGSSTNQIPNTYANNLTATLTSPGYPSGWLIEYNRYMYDNGVDGEGRLENDGRYTLQTARAILSHQFDPTLILSARIGYEDNQFLVTDSAGMIYGAGFQWNPSPRTQAGGFWEHRFYGSSYDLQMSHRLPNSAIRANVSRGLSSYPQLALAIPAGTTVTQFLDAAFTTRIPDPAERATAIEQFLARTGLPPTLAAPVNIYGTTLTLQDAQNISFVVFGVRNAITFTIFNVKSEAISGTGEVLPPAFQFGQNNTQTGVGLAYSYQLSGFTSFGANAGYSRTRTNDTALSDVTSSNANFGLTLNHRLGAKTNGSAGVTYSLFKSAGDNGSPDTDTLTVFAGVNHTF